jgi:hypothetical protein
MSAGVEATSSPRDAVELVRAAVVVLRRASRDLPRGPWRWGDPDLGDDEPGTDPRPELWPVHPPHRRPNPLSEPVPGLRDPYGPFPDDLPSAVRPPVEPRRPLVLDPALADALAALLERHADQIERDDRTMDVETARAAVAVARSVLRSDSTSAPGAPGGVGPT